MVVNKWKILLITLIYLSCSKICEGNKDASNNINKLEYWQREPDLNDARRGIKKQTRPDKTNDKYTRVFEPVDSASDSDLIRSSNHVITDEVKEDKANIQHEKISPLSGIHEQKQSSVIIWKSYINKDKFKNSEAITLKFKSTNLADTPITENKYNAGLDHIHFKKMSDSERILNTKKNYKLGKKMKNVNPSELNETKDITRKYWKLKIIPDSQRILKRIKEEEYLHNKLKNDYSSELSKTMKIITKSWQFKNTSESERILKRKKEDKFYNKINNLRPFQENKTMGMTTRYWKKTELDEQRNKLKHYRRYNQWSTNNPGFSNKMGKSNLQSGKKLEMFDKNYLLRNRLKHRKKIIIRY